MASSSGSRCALVQGSHAVVTSTRGKCAPFSPRCSAWPIPSSRLTGTIRCSTGRPSLAINSARGSITPVAVSPGESVSITMRIPALGNGSRRWCSAKGSSLTSVVVMQTPGEGGGPTQSDGWRLTCQPVLQLVLKSPAQPAGQGPGSNAADGMVVDACDGKDFDRRPEQDDLVCGQ